MSLRAKMEAVIYAAEDPVTLAQLTAIFAAEALAGRTQTPTPSTQELFPTAETAADDHAEAAASDAAIEEAVEHPEQVAATQPDGFVGEAETPSAAPPGASDDAEQQKRAARQRDREAREEIRRLIDELIADYDRSDRGIEIREIAGGYRVATRPEYHDAVRTFVKSLKPVMKLSLQALETLAVIAYKQPVTAPEVSDIRGVDSGGVLGSLISRKLVTTAGRKQVIGRPILYKTTKEFLLRFGLKDLNELPSMEEFERMAGELVESEPSTQLDLPAIEQGEPAMPTLQPQTRASEEEPDEPASEAFPDEPSAAADVQAAPEHAEQLDDAEVAARAQASVQVDDESTPGHDLPGVTSDTAGRLDIDSSPRTADDGLRGEED